MLSQGLVFLFYFKAKKMQDECKVASTVRNVALVFDLIIIFPKPLEHAFERPNAGLK